MTSLQQSQLAVSLQIVHSLLYYFLLIPVCVEVRFISFASFNFLVLQLDVYGLFEVDTIRTTPDSMEIKSLACLAKSSDTEHLLS